MGSRVPPNVVGGEDGVDVGEDATGAEAGTVTGAGCGAVFGLVALNLLRSSRFVPDDKSLFVDIRVYNRYKQSQKTNCRKEQLPFDPNRFHTVTNARDSFQLVLDEPGL